MFYFLFATYSFLVLLSGIWIVKKIKKTFNPNRWIVAFTAPFIVIIPIILTPTLPKSIWGVIITLFIWANIYFFETTKELVETRKIKVGYKSH